MPLFIKAIDPELQVLGPTQQIKFDQNLASLQFDTTFVPTSFIPSQNNFETRNSALSGFRWVHLTTDGDTFGQLKLQSFVNASPTGTDIVSFNQDGSITFNSSVIINIPPLIDVEGTSQTFSFSGAHLSTFKLLNTFAATGGNPSFVDLNFINSTTGGFKFRHTSSSTDYLGTGNFELDYINDIGGITPIFSVSITSGTTPVSVQFTANNVIFSNYVGIEGVSPNAPLQFSNTLNNSIIALHQTGSISNQFFGLGVNSGIFRYQIDATTSSNNWYAGTGSSTSNLLMSLKGTGDLIVQGKLGIGGVTPNAPLQFNDIIANRVIVLVDSNTHDPEQFIGWGVNIESGHHILRSQIKETSEYFDWNAGVVPGFSHKVMRLSGEGLLNLYDLGAGTQLTIDGSSSNNGDPAIPIIKLNCTTSTVYGLSFCDETGSDAWGTLVFHAGTPNSQLSLLAVKPSSSCILGTANTTLTISDDNSTFSNGVIINDPGLGFGNLILQSAEAMATALFLNNTNLSSTYYAIGFGNGGGHITAEIAYNNTTETLTILSAEPAAYCQIGTSNSYLTFSETNLDAIFNEKVGIGGITPHAPLQFNNYVQNRVVVFYDGFNNDHQFFGMGINASTQRFQISTTASFWKFYAGTSSTTSDLAMTLTGTGDLTVEGTYYGKTAAIAAYIGALSPVALTAGVPVALGSFGDYTTSYSNQFSYISSAGSFRYISTVKSPINVMVSCNLCGYVTAIGFLQTTITLSIYKNGSLWSQHSPTSQYFFNAGLGANYTLNITGQVEVSTSDDITIYITSSVNDGFNVVGANTVIKAI